MSTKEAHRSQQAAYAARQKELDPEAWGRRRTAINNAWRTRNPEKARAHWAVNNALRAGRLKRPDHCQKCDKACKPEASHDDYAKPLEVEWLCRLCHAEKDNAHD